MKFHEDSWTLLKKNIKTHQTSPKHTNKTWSFMKTHETSWKPSKKTSKNMKVHLNSWNFREKRKKTWKFIEIMKKLWTVPGGRSVPGSSRRFRAVATLSGFIFSNYFQLLPSMFHVFYSRCVMNFHGISCCFMLVMKFHEIPWNFMKNHVFSMKTYVFPWNFMKYHVISWEFIKIHKKTEN